MRLSALRSEGAASTLIRVALADNLHLPTRGRMVGSFSIAVLIGMALLWAGCASVASSTLRPPPGRSAREVARDTADCQTASRPGVGVYAKATGVWLLTRLAAPVVAVVDWPRSDGAETPTTSGEVFGKVGVAAAFGVVAGPVIATDVAGRLVAKAREQALDRCLVARGYTAPATKASPKRLLVVLDAESTEPSFVPAFLGELERRGYVFGKTVYLEIRGADNVEVAGWDVLVAGSSAIAVTLTGAAGATPIVIAASELSVANTRPAAATADRGLPNVTGTTLVTPEVNRARLELLARALPQAKRIAVLANPSNAAHAEWMRTLVLVPGLLLRRVDAREPADVDEALASAARDGAQALLVMPDPTFRRSGATIASLARGHRLPAVGGDVGFADAGGLLAYHPARLESWRDAAGFVDRILKGAPAGSLPMRAVEQHEVVLNLATADALGLVVPAYVALRATRVVR